MAETPAPSACESDPDSRSSDSMGPSSARFAALLADSLDSGVGSTQPSAGRAAAPPPRPDAQIGLPQRLLDLGTYVADTPPEAGDGSWEAPSDPTLLEVAPERLPGLGEGREGVLEAEGGMVEPSSVSGTDLGGEVAPEEMVRGDAVCRSASQKQAQPGLATPRASGGGSGGAVAARLTPAEQDLVDTGLVSPPRLCSLPETCWAQHSSSLQPPAVAAVGGFDRSPAFQQAVEGAAESPVGGGQGEEGRRQVVLDLGSQVQAVAVSACGR